MPVPALSSAPMPSNSWSISSDAVARRAAEEHVLEQVREPGLGVVSTREPVPIQKPSAADRTESMCSVTTRTPESSSVSACALVHRCCLVAIAVAAVARAAGAARAVAAAVAAAVAVAVTARPRSPPRRGAAAVAAATAAAGADRGELLDGLARDRRVVGEAQADAAALAVDLDHADVDLVALVEDVLDRVDALAGRDVGDVQQAVGALGQLDEGAERRRLDDLAGRTRRRPRPPWSSTGCARRASRPARRWPSRRAPGPRR